MDDPNVVLRASTCYSLSIPFSNPCPFIFLLMLGNNSKDGKVMWEMNDKREQLLGFNLQHERTSFLSSASSTIGIRRDIGKEWIMRPYDWKRSCAWLLHTNIKNQGKGMLEVP